jgi:hypothetical protein
MAALAEKAFQKMQIRRERDDERWPRSCDVWGTGVCPEVARLEQSRRGAGPARERHRDDADSDRVSVSPSATRGECRCKCKCKCKCTC